jgi:hypothetical protein
VRQHVRLGYAATEPGYQSDTVTIGIELASTATTRRGLYVATTRGRDENWICVITHSGDVAEARDVLETILAVDRTDVPAVTQRQRLAEQNHDVVPAMRHERAARCEIPDWFDPLRAHTRRQLAEAEQRTVDNAATRQRLHTNLDAAEREVRWLDHPTRRQRDQLAAADHDLDDATRQHRAAEQRLKYSGLRGRRHARRDLAAAENRLNWANHTVEQLQAQASPDVARYHRAREKVHQLGDELRHHDTRELLDRYAITDRIPELHERLGALDTWWRFATGDSIDVDRLAHLVDVLGTIDGGHRSQYRWLADAVGQYCHDAGIHLATLQPEVPAVEAPGLAIG